MLMTWASSWKVAVMMACEATMAAKIERMSEGQKVPGGTELKKGLEYAEGSSEIKAA